MTNPSNYKDYKITEAMVSGLKRCLGCCAPAYAQVLAEDPTKFPDAMYVARWSMAHGRTHDGCITAHSLHDPSK